LEKEWVEMNDRGREGNEMKKKKRKSKTQRKSDAETEESTGHAGSGIIEQKE
jgi:hypothetical protein